MNSTYDWNAYLDYPFYYYEYEDMPDYKTAEQVIQTSAPEVNFRLMGVAMIVTIVHLVMLFQKSLRTSTVFIFMIGIGFSDILSIVVSYNDNEETYSQIPGAVMYKEESWCYDDPWVPIDIIQQLTSIGFGLSRRLSIWLAVAMALIRMVSVMFPMSNFVQKLAKPSMAILIIFGFSVFFLGLESWYLLFYGWLVKIKDVSTDGMCVDPKEKGDTYIFVVPQSMTILIPLFQVVAEQYIKLIPTILYPILSISLFVQLRIIKRRSRRMRSQDANKSDNTILLILFMTIIFMLTEGVGGLELILWYTNNNWYESESAEFLSMISTISIHLMVTLRVVNTISHPIVCILMSSQYRDTVSSTLRLPAISLKARKIMKLDKGSSNKTDSISHVSPTAIS